MSAIVLPGPIQRRVEAFAGGFLEAPGVASVDFSQPPGQAALLEPVSVSWRIFKNPVSLFVGGVAAVLLELAEPRVRAGVWEHTSFRAEPVGRLRRTGMAAMVTIYAARSQAEAMIAAVNRRHALISGRADDGRAYAADEPELLDWVQATASFGFIEAYHRFVRPLSRTDRDRAWAEAATPAHLYGATGSPSSQAQWQTQLRATAPSLRPSPVIFEFLDIMRRAPALPAIGRSLQHLLIRAAVDLVPEQVAAMLDIQGYGQLTAVNAAVVRTLARGADRLPLTNAPPAQACLRLGLPADWLYRN